MTDDEGRIHLVVRKFKTSVDPQIGPQLVFSYFLGPTAPSNIFDRPRKSPKKTSTIFPSHFEKLRNRRGVWRLIWANIILVPLHNLTSLNGAADKWGKLMRFKSPAKKSGFRCGPGSENRLAPLQGRVVGHMWGLFGPVTRDSPQSFLDKPCFLEQWLSWQAFCTFSFCIYENLFCR